MNTFQVFAGLFDTSEGAHLFVGEDNVVWINATLICRQLGFKNVTQTVKTKTDEDERQLCDVGAINDAWFVSEYGIWGLILSSKKPEALKLKRILKHEVLPSIRKQGSYIAPTATIEQLALATKRIRELEAELEGKISEATENRIVEKTMDFLCETEDQNGDPLLFQTYLKNENKRYKEFVQAIGVEIARASSSALKGRIQKKLASMD